MMISMHDKNGTIETSTHHTVDVVLLGYGVVADHAPRSGPTPFVLPLVGHFEQLLFRRFEAQSGS